MKRQELATPPIFNDHQHQSLANLSDLTIPVTRGKAEEVLAAESADGAPATSSGMSHNTKRLPQEAGLVVHYGGSFRWFNHGARLSHFALLQ